jgi:hypothetical protein
MSRRSSPTSDRRPTRGPRRPRQHRPGASSPSARTARRHWRPGSRPNTAVEADPTAPPRSTPPTAPDGPGARTADDVARFSSGRTATSHQPESAAAARPPATLGGKSAPVGGPVSAGWREGTLTRARELATLCDWASENTEVEDPRVFVDSIRHHLKAAKDAAELARARPKDRLPRFRTGSLRERAKSNLDAAEAQLLNFAPPDYVLGQLPGLLTHIQCHLIPNDPRRIEFERLARRLGLHDADHGTSPDGATPQGHARNKNEHLALVREERGRIVSAVRAASSASLREQVRVRSFRDVLVVTSALMGMLVIAMAVIGFLWPTMIPLCFAPEDGGQAVVVCPTAQSEPFSTASQQGTGTQSSAEQSKDIDDFVRETVSPQDILVVELVGLAAAAVAAAGAIRTIRGSSERSNLPVALAVLKLPTGALTAFLGLLLMRGQFVPGLSALDTSAQILAWALVFGYAQQLFTRLVDRQGQTVLDGVRGADQQKPDLTPP